MSNLVIDRWNVNLYKYSLGIVIIEEDGWYVKKKRRENYVWMILENVVVMC